jgi:peptidoglycan hydrolase-like protein with peptidoglycan-binding domain
VNLTAQQRTRIQQTVLASSSVPRVNNVNFALSVGTLVPTSVRVVDVAPALVEINPAWRGHQYFVVRDDIIIVDHSRKIVAVVPVGSGGARLGTGGSTALNLSSDQIREVQTVLKERGFNVVVDGKMGSRTMEAITAFQRQQGFQVSGRIDNQTISALGLSNKIGAQGSATTGEGASAGQSGANQQQAPAQQNQGANQPSSGQSSGQQQAPAQQNQGANQPSTSGQSSSQQQAPAQQGGAKQQEPAQQNQDVNQPSTSGQSSSQQQAPAQQNQAAGQNSGNK